MSDLFKIPVTQYWLYDCWIDTDGNPCNEGAPGARFKKSHRVRKGVAGSQPTKTLSRKWYARIGGKPVALSPNKGAARIMLGERLKKAELRKAGAGDAFEEHRERPLTEHLADFRAALLAENNTEKHAITTVTRGTKLFAGCQFVFMGDLQASRVAEWLADEREAGRLSITTSNYWLRDAKSFFKWMVKDRRIDSNPLVHLSPLNAEVEDHRQRRALEPDEYQHLLVAAQIGPQRCRLAGPDRFMLYLVASNTGLRNQELASLTPESFELDSDEPNVIVQAGYSKHRRQDVQPIRHDLAELLREYLVGKPAGEPIWAGRWWRKAAKMIRADLKDARRQWIDEAGEDAEERKAREKSDFLTYVNDEGEVFDFYAQRGQMITALEQSGVSLKTLQALARHSRVETTLKHYARKPRLADTRAALDALPALPTNRPKAPAETLQATGTDGDGAKNVCARFAQTDEPGRNSVRLVDTTGMESTEASVGASGCGGDGLKPAETAGNQKRERGPSRIRTGDGGFAIHCLTAWLRGPRDSFIRYNRHTQAGSLIISEASLLAHSQNLRTVMLRTCGDPVQR